MSGTLFPEIAPAALTRSEHLTFKGNLKQGRHGWLRLTPAYSLHLVEDLIRHLPPGTAVLDPFCGTGTTALASSALGHPATTVDINPFLVWLTRAKCIPYLPSDTQAALTFVAHQLLPVAADTTGRVWLPPIHDIGKWWSEAHLAPLGRVCHALRSLPATPPIRTLAVIAFCKAAISLAHVSFGHQSMSFRKRPDSATLFEDGAVSEVQHALSTATEQICAGALSTQPVAPVTIYHGDSRHLDTILHPRCAGALITSPPYPNRMSYVRELRPYMYWLEYLTSGRDAGELDWQSIGGTWGCATSNLSRWTPDPTITIPYEPLPRILSEVRTRSPLLATYIHKYFEDVTVHISNLPPLLAPGAQVHYIVGNSKFYDTLLPVHHIYASILTHRGFADTQVHCIRKRTSKRELFEYRVSARNP